MLHGDSLKIGMYRSINPASGEESGQFDIFDDSELDRRLGRALSAFEEMKDISFVDRATCLNDLAAKLEAGKNAFAHLMTVEMGKPIRASTAEIKKCALVCRYFAEYGESFLEREVVATEASESYVSYHSHSVLSWQSCPGISRSGSCFA